MPWPGEGKSESMLTFFLVFAIVGGVIIIVQLVFSLLGVVVDEVNFSDGHDVEHTSSSFFGILGIRSLSAGAAFFGLTGMAAATAKLPLYVTIPLALVAGLAGMFLIAWLLKTLYGLHSQGNVDIRKAVRKVGRVYLTVPGEESGKGKVTIELQNRTIECLAITHGKTIPTGKEVVVVEVGDEDVLRVWPMKDS